MFFANWRRRSLTIDDDAWRGACSDIKLLAHYDANDRARLRTLVHTFLESKHFSAAQNFALDDALRLRTAIYACVPVLNLGLEYYAPWREIVIYPAPFLPAREFEDEAGVVHVVRDALAGEAWLQGPIILSAPDIVNAGVDGVNVVLHECAHKLDMLNGDANGFPPLHADMDAHEWSTVFSSAYATLCDEPADDTGVLDPYGTESPGEFFAVASEAFFETPRDLRAELPALYRQLRAFYRQDLAT